MPIRQSAQLEDCRAGYRRHDPQVAWRPGEIPVTFECTCFPSPTASGESPGARIAIVGNRRLRTLPAQFQFPGMKLREGIRIGSAARASSKDQCSAKIKPLVARIRLSDMLASMAKENPAIAMTARKSRCPSFFHDA